MTDAEITKRLADAMGWEIRGGDWFCRSGELALPLESIRQAIECAEKISPIGFWQIKRLAGKYFATLRSTEGWHEADTPARALCLACVAELDRQQKVEFRTAHEVQAAEEESRRRYHDYWRERLELMREAAEAPVGHIVEPPEESGETIKCDCGSGKAKDDTGHYPWCRTQRSTT